jgi:hypothetical protein
LNEEEGWNLDEKAPMVGDAGDTRVALLLD